MAHKWDIPFGKLPSMLGNEKKCSLDQPLCEITTQAKQLQITVNGEGVRESELKGPKTKDVPFSSFLFSVKNTFLTYLTLTSIQAQDTFHRVPRIRNHFKSHPEKQKRLMREKQNKTRLPSHIYIFLI